MLFGMAFCITIATFAVPLNTLSPISSAVTDSRYVDELRGAMVGKIAPV